MGTRREVGFKMKTVVIDQQEYTVPDIKFRLDQDQSPKFEIIEGELAGKWFSIENFRMDDEDETLLWYDLLTEDEKDVEILKPVVDNYIVIVLHEEMKRQQLNENDTKCD